MLFYFIQHDLRAPLYREAGDTGTNRREGNRRELLFDCTLQTIDGGVPQTVLAGETAEVHARRMDHIASLKLSAAGESCFAERNRTEHITFLLDRRSAFTPDSAGHPGAELQTGIGGIYYCINVSLSDIPLLKNNL